MPEGDVADRSGGEERPAAESDERQRLLEAERASRLKDEFLATLSHELRTPLNSILGWTQLLLTRRLSPEDTERALQTIRRSAETQARLIEDILDASRLVGGKLKLNARPVRLAAVVHAVAETASPAAEARRITLRVRTPVDDDWIVADPDRLEQVTWNLLSNALKFTPPGGTVEVEADTDEHWAEIRVQDTGAGIAPQFLPSLFERFRQADPSTTRPHGGLGLGLALVRHLVELHGGTVRAHSAGEGKGATFVVRVPIRPQSPEPGGGAPRRVPTPGGRLPVMPSLEDIGVLLVDAHLQSWEPTVQALERLGARVASARGYGEAVAALDRQWPDVLLANVERCQPECFELLRRIRQLEERTGRRLPAAAMASYAQPTDERWLVAGGFDAYLALPASPAIVALTVARLAGRARVR